MPLTDAERAKRYREKKKQRDPSFIEKERKRQQMLRVPRGEMAPNRLLSARNKCAGYKKTAKERRKTAENIESTVCDTATQDQPQTLIVTLPAVAQQKRRHTIVATRNQQISQLNDTNKKIDNKLKATQKAFQRYKERACSSKDSTTCSESDQLSTSIEREDDCPPLRSPLKRAHADIREAGETPTKLPKVVDILEAHHTIIGEMGKHITTSEKRAVIKSPVIKSIRAATRFANTCKVSLSSLNYKEQRRRRIANVMIRQTVKKFYYRDDVSSCLPGKKDYVKVGKINKQKRVMNDTLGNLHAKFRIENPTVSISCATFKRLRPKQVVTVSFLSRRTCLCKQHQNFSLILQGLRKSGKQVSNIPDEVARTYTNDEFEKLVLSSDAETTVHFQQWERVEVSYGTEGKTCKKVKLVEKTMSMKELGDIALKQFVDFGKHRERVISQYRAARQIKEKMPPGHISVQCDFAENYCYGEKEEVQSAYYSKDQITLHPAVFHHRTEVDAPLKVTSACYVSDVTDHTAPMVFAILKQIVTLAKQTVPELKYIHYLSDSPSSQYRNKHLMYIIAQHDKMFGIPCTWTYFESGHGKGPCDGIGGSSKRLADLAVKTDKASIRCAQDFADWGNKSSKKVQYSVVSQSDYIVAKNEINLFNAKPVPGTMSTHAVQTSENGVVCRKTSCVCSECFANKSPECNWINVPICGAAFEIAETQPTPQTLEADEVQPSGSQGLPFLNCESGTYALVKFATRGGDVHYVGEVVGPGDDDDEYELSFLVAKKGKHVTVFAHPADEDISDVHISDIVANLPMPDTGMTARTSGKMEFDFNFASYKLG